MALIGDDGDNELHGSYFEGEVDGLGGDDTLYGGGGGGSVNGGDGNDILYGLNSNDTLNGGNGDDIMTGYGERDIFVFAPGFGNDVITDFSINDGETLDFRALNMATFADLQPYIHADGNDTVISLFYNSQTETLRLKNVDPTSLTASNFYFNTFRDPVVVVGTDGNDMLFGGRGYDDITGGGGDDIISGGKGGNLYHFARGFGSDTIVDFHSGDRLDLSALNISSLDTLKPYMQDLNGDTILSFYFDGQAETITLAGVDSLSLSRGYFLFSGNTAKTVTGTSHDDLLFGANGNDTLDGAEGSDQMVGGNGNDTYLVDNAGDVVVEQAAQGHDTVLASVDYTLGAEVEDLIGSAVVSLTLTGNGLDNVVQGNNLADILYGLGGNDTVSGGAGADVMYGGAGNDIYYVDDSGDIVSEQTVAGTDDGGSDTIMSNVTYSLPDNVENLTLTGAANIDATGSEADNTLTGNSGGNSLWGLGGNDVLSGGSGADIMYGGTGDDTYHVNSITDLVVEDSGAGLDLVLSSASYSLGANIENLTLTGSGKISGTGNGLDNVVVGNGAVNRLAGGGGNDTLAGGGGDDIFVFSRGGDDDSILDFQTGDQIDLSAFNIAAFTSLDGHIQVHGNDTVIAFTYGGRAETITLKDVTVNAVTASSFIFNSSNTGRDVIGTANSDNLFGGLGKDTISGGGGADIIDGGAGNDMLTGGTGADRYIFGHGSGQDTITDFSASEIIDVSGSTGFSGFIALEQVGADTLVRFSATDTLVLQHVTASHLTGANFSYAPGPLPITGSEHDDVLIGTTTNDTLNGLGGNDTLYGANGNDILYGGAGGDTMSGGADNDAYYVDSTADVVVELADGGTDIVYSSLTYQLGDNVERVTLIGTGNVWAFGNAGNNTLIGNDSNNKLLGGDGNDTLGGNGGNDTLDGGKGADNMKGGAGDDRYYIDSRGDLVTEYSNAGSDTVLINGTYTLTANVENLIITGSANRFGTGNALDNHITGSAGNNTLGGAEGNDIIDGGKGADLMRGGTGDDTFYVDNIGDVVAEYSNAGTDLVYSSVSFVMGGNVENLTLTGAGNLNGTGNVLDNILTGNAGSNRLNGANGNDTLTGGLGADTFVFAGHIGVDTVTDFSVADGDLIDVSALTFGTPNEAIIHQSGDDVIINFGFDTIIKVLNANAGNADFLGHIVW